ncbi:hypothetical protein MFRU_018g01200 [Monilinia fructicola]|uniref:Trichodiene oxygenase n=1 Tax=Monilinia fructicola TaxID=38448 RepID=A0A5M9JRI3_MONFR|nr:hypothetical protein EYC84_002035 [Monilinia fructicola]KAG4029015.1 hypothetical protein MFRU_018g01200 [Monilinia fructicola]
MKGLTDLLSLSYAAKFIIFYFATLVIYRMVFHPLARFPGPKLAAATRWYEAYYDVVHEGQYTFKIKRLHKEYGPIIRISPNELHVIDPAFYEKLYCYDGRWDRYAWAMSSFSTAGSVIWTVDHDMHRARRVPLNLYFSKAQVFQKQALINRVVEKFCDRILALSGMGIFDLGAAISAFTRDVSTEFILCKTYNCLEKEDFDIGRTNIFQRAGRMRRITKHAPWFGPFMKSLPLNWVMKISDEGTKLLFQYLEDTRRDTEIILDAISSTTPDTITPHTMIHDILDSNLPAKDKKLERLLDEVATISGAGFETTASVLRLVIFHIFSNPAILERLRDELASSSMDDTQDIKRLERLPYLTSVLMEGLRLSPAVASRSARIAPDRDLWYKEWRIPAGTPIGMTTLLMHTDENLYPDPMRFDPERWTDLEARKKTEKTYGPFSRGTRNCLGMHLAWAECYLFLAAVAQRFDFEFQGVTAKDFECERDQFMIGTFGKGVMHASATVVKS